MSDEGLLSGVRVVDLTQGVTGPYATKLFADFGAEVIKIEHPNVGDVARRMGPFPDDEPHLERSGTFLHSNTNKLGVTLNIKSEPGQRVLRRLLENADVFVEGFRPGVMESLGFGYERVREINPAIVMASVSNFGQWGPYRDFEITELTAYAVGVSMHCTGVPEREPMRLPNTATLMQSGNMLAAVVMNVLFGAMATGQGEYVDHSIMETQVASADRNGPALTAMAYSGELSFRRSMMRRFSVLPFGAYPCADGYVHFTASQASWWPKFCTMMGHPELIDDPRFTGDNFSDPELGFEADAYFIPWLLTKTKSEAMDLCADVGGTPINTMEDVFSDPHFRGRDFFKLVDHPAAGRLEYPGAQVKLQQGSWRAGRAPLLGEHNSQILCGRLGLSYGEVVQLAREGVI